METKVFDRIEKKYLITKKDQTKLRKIIKEHMEKDKYHQSEVFNLYFDTDSYDFIVQSIDQPNFKEKLRARSYGGYDRVFLEIKTKLRAKDDANIGYKRRVMITQQDFDDLVARKATATELASRQIEKSTDHQIAKEVDYFIEHFSLTPKILVHYSRESYKSPDNLRITFDEKLKYRHQNLGFFSAKSDKIYFKDKKNIIMEIKAHGAFPLWLVELLSKNHIYPQRFSKIGHIYTRLRKENHV